MQIDEIIEVLNPEDQEFKKDKLLHVHGMNPHLLKKLQEDKRRRERQLLRQRLAQAVDFLEADDMNVSDIKEKSFFNI